MKKKIIYIFVALLGVFAILFSLFEMSKARTFQVFGKLVARVETNEKVIALTFDDGPTEYTDDVLKILKEKEVKATFYAIGSELGKNPEIGKQITAEGHDLANHSYTHQRFYLKSQQFIDEEIQKTNKAIRDAGYKGEITFRPPYGKKLFGLPWYLSKHNITTITWDVEPDTFYLGDKDAMIKYTLENTKPGSIIIIHPFCAIECKAAREALPVIIDELKKEGYIFVSVNELREYEGK